MRQSEKRERQRETEKDRERQREIERDREIERQGERERERESIMIWAGHVSLLMSYVTPRRGS